MPAVLSLRSIPSLLRRILPGALLCLMVAQGARLLQTVEAQLLGAPHVEALVLAILLGTAARALWVPPSVFQPGIRYAGKGLLEFAVALLGLSVDLPAVVRNGAALPVAVASVVLFSLAGSYAIGRALGLRRPLAVLIACGNSICGNSAIAAVAPAIAAESEDVAAAIATTAVMGVVVVVWLPSLIPLAGLTPTQYGAIAGLTVYAVPQVVAATVPAGPAAVQMGTLVKLLRVLLLGPLVAGLGVLKRQRTQRGDTERRVALLPPFIAIFLLLALGRAVGLIPAGWGTPTREFATWLTTLSMAALGLGVDVRALARVGPRVALAVSGSLALLGGAALLAVRLLRVV